MRILLSPARDLAQPDNGLGSFHLAEEGALVREFMMTPVLEQALCRRRHAPIRWIGALVHEYACDGMSGSAAT